MTVAGIDLGTSGVKVLLADEHEQILAEANTRISTLRHHPGWSEQNPLDWVHAIASCFEDLKQRVPKALAEVRGIGLSGHMLGPVLIDQADLPVRPTLLWNDERSTAECQLLLERVPDLGMRANGTPDPGMGAPKLLWLAHHEPEVIRRADCVLLPKDYVRLWLTGDRASEPSDAAGLMLLDCATGRWDAALCEAAGWPQRKLPPLENSWGAAGGLRSALARAWGMKSGVPVAAGGGDNMVCSLGVGAASSGDTVISIGTSAVTCVVASEFRPAPEIAVMTSAHVVPKAFLSMGVVMSATATVDWLSELTQTPIPTLEAEAQEVSRSLHQEAPPLMRPHFSGIRTPHNLPGVRGTVNGLSLTTTRGMLMWSAMEGVAFQVYECLLAQQGAGVSMEEVRMVGGGAQSLLWCEMIASLLEQPVVLTKHREFAASIGAARLAMAASGGDLKSVLFAKRPVEYQIEPRPELREFLLQRFQQFLEMLPKNPETTE